MFLVPGVAVSILSFPGVIVHEYAHQLCCRLCKVKVLKVCYFRVGNPAGYVIHDRVENPWQHLLIGTGPLFLNTAMGLFFGFIALMCKDIHTLKLLFSYLGIAIAMHSFPSAGDAGSMWKSIWQADKSIAAKITLVPVMAMVYIGALGSVAWLDVIYGVCVSVLLPKFFMHL